MRKTGRTPWVLLVLFGLFLILVLPIGGPQNLPAQFIPTIVQASGRQSVGPTSQCTTSHEGPSFGGTLVINGQEVICSDITSFGGVITIKGQVRGDVVAFGSSVIIDGIVTGNVDLYGSNAVLHNGSHVHGNILLYGGSFYKDKGALLDGRPIYNSGHFGWVFGSDDTFSFPFLSILTWVALGLIFTLLLPEHVMLVRTTAANHKGRSFVVGLLTVLIAPAVLVVLIALILPIPLAIIVALGLIAAWALGTVAVGWLIGEHLVHAIAPQYNRRTLQLLVGLTVLTLAGGLPLIGWFITVVAGLVGLGAVLLSRFGTRLYGRPKGPLNL
ncbi:MAG TPA: polymer-forming cytoskeletal protein [Ktedonobacteraceae bacterium]|nr:polymer-forming cytoskeletal protein [Ktedonobacteraceae bacterium]